MTPTLKTDEELGAMNASELIHHLEATHHVYTREALQNMLALSREAAQIEPALAPLKALVHELASDLDPHLMKEERILFPFIQTLFQARSNGRTPPRPPFGTVANPIRMMRMEHDNAERLLYSLDTEMKKHPAMMGKHPLFRAIDDLAKDLRQHMHTENKFLFPKAESLE